MAERVTIKRCAIYTRKSTEEGLDQAYNSLAEQRDSCTAYIASQRHEGWVAVEAHYDDGGFSGGTVERPALQALFADLTAGAIDIIVVYKIDRLTRSLADFAKLTDLLYKHDVSFVAVTQQFNTSTSMGRLTLNVLLSFAQFEREVTGERIRDKIAASKRRGIWMGGRTPLGYDVKDKKLVVNPRKRRSSDISSADIWNSNPSSYCNPTCSDRGSSRNTTLQKMELPMVDVQYIEEHSMHF